MWLPQVEAPAAWHYLRMMLPGGVNQLPVPRLAPAGAGGRLQRIPRLIGGWDDLPVYPPHLKFYESIAAVSCWSLLVD